jgi:adenosylcobyric acid synthase
MLGQSLLDPHGVESPEPSVPGLGLLPLRTRFERTKTTAQVRARVRDASFLGHGGDEELAGYEIHMGVIEHLADARAPFVITQRNGQQALATDGAVGAGGAVVGTMLHGLFENASLRAGLLRYLRDRKGLAEPSGGREAVPSRFAEYDRLEAVLREHIDHDLLWRIARLPRARP